MEAEFLQRLLGLLLETTEGYPLHRWNHHRGLHFKRLRGGLGRGWAFRFKHVTARGLHLDEFVDHGAEALLSQFTAVVTRRVGRLEGRLCAHLRYLIVACSANATAIVDAIVRVWFFHYRLDHVFKLARSICTGCNLRDHLVVGEDD